MVRVRCVVLILLMVALPLAAARKGSSSKTPPANLHKVGDHWTAYDPPDPASFGAGANVHVIAAGDTLWGLAASAYNNPYMWPQIWEANTYIRDAHWIYPGDPVLLTGEAASVPAGGSSSGATNLSGPVSSVGTLGPAPGGSEGGITASMSAPSIGGTPIAIGTEADIYCYGYLGAVDEQMPTRITSFEDLDLKYDYYMKTQDTGVAEGDVVYINAGMSGGLIPGETYLVVEPGELVKNPRTKAVLGRHYDYRGQVKILCATDDRATALVVQSCKDLHIGDRVKPMPMNPIPLARETAMADFCTAPSGKANGLIVSSQDYSGALGEGNLVEINLGKDDFVEPGDFLTVYRDTPGNIRQVLGEIGVLTAENHTATGKILRMRYHMNIGDNVELK